MQLASHLRQFLRATTLHGLRYLVEEGSAAVRLAWGLLIAVSFSLVGLVFLTALEESERSPFVTNVDMVDVREIPFPAVTYHPAELEPARNFIRK